MEHTVIGEPLGGEGREREGERERERSMRERSNRSPQLTPYPTPRRPYPSILLGSWIISCVTLLCYAFAGANDCYHLVCSLFFISNLAFGVNLVMYNSQLPGLCKDHKDVRDAIDRKAPPAEIVGVFKNSMELMNDWAVLYGYLGGVLLLLICITLFIIGPAVLGITYQTTYCESQRMKGIRS